MLDRLVFWAVGRVGAESLSAARAAYRWAVQGSMWRTRSRIAYTSCPSRASGASRSHAPTILDAQEAHPPRPSFPFGFQANASHLVSRFCFVLQRQFEPAKRVHVERPRPSQRVSSLRGGHVQAHARHVPRPLSQLKRIKGTARLSCSSQSKAPTLTLLIRYRTSSLRS